MGTWLRTRPVHGLSLTKHRVDNGLARAPYRQGGCRFPGPFVGGSRRNRKGSPGCCQRRDSIARTARVTVIERLGLKLNLNGHWPVLALEGADTFEQGKARFHRAPAPRPGELKALPRTRITRLTRTRVRAGVRVGEEEQSCLDFDLNSSYEQSTRAAIG
ncbi:MAG: hypothetical protein GKR94_25380 [Gammaproteobacteria bacterium]|nr:hypothetical protein [Gammaproteobacteria bacterium]